MKKLIITVAILIVALPSISANYSASRRKSAKSPYAEQYRVLKKSLELDKEELSQTELLEAVAVKFAGMFDQANTMIERLSARTLALEAENRMLKARLDENEKRLANAEKRIEDAEARLKSFDDDLNKAFKWMNKADGDLYNEIGFGIGAKVKKLDSQVNKLDAQVNNWCNGLNVQMDNLRSIVNANSRNIQTLWDSIRRW